MHRSLIVLLLLCLPYPAQADEALWDRLRAGGLVVAVRHAHAPGTGDPSGFRLDDCSTQRNLSAEGRAQAEALGAAIRQRGVPVGRVLTSRWCRAIDTARLAFGAADPEPALDSLFGRRDLAEAQTEAAKALVRAWPRTAGNLFLVGHNANIAALTGLSPADAEMIVLTTAADGSIQVLGRLRS